MTWLAWLFLATTVYLFAAVCLCARQHARLAEQLVEMLVAHGDKVAEWEQLADGWRAALERDVAAQAERN